MPMDPEDVGSNPSANRPFHDVLAVRFSRRSMLGGGLGAAAVAVAGGGLGAVLTGCAPEPGGAPTPAAPLLGFDSVPANSNDVVTVADGYVAEVLIPWGTPLLSTGPAWKKDATNTAAEQAQQIGMHHDGMSFFPVGTSGKKGLLVLNHEYVDQVLLFSDGPATMTQEKVDKALAGHGVAVVMIQLIGGKWRRVDAPENRRITGATPVDFSGPVTLAHPALQSDNAPMGTLNNCANGQTPWGTYLACEENWNGYFGTTDAAWTATPAQARYGVSKTGFGYNWHLADPASTWR